MRDCLTKDGLSLVPDRFAKLIGAIEVSIAHFLSSEPEGRFRDVHDALRELWVLAHEDDPPIGQMKAQLARLPLAAREYIGRRAPNVMRRLGIGLDGPAGEPLERAFKCFLQWTKTAEAVRQPEPQPPLPKKLAALVGTELVRLPPLVTALRVLSYEGARIVKGRSRGACKRSRPRIEPLIMGTLRGADKGGHSGRPDTAGQRELVMYLAMDWSQATGSPPKPGRSDNTGFGDLVHSVFQWLTLPDGSATHAMRRYWAALRQRQARGDTRN